MKDRALALRKTSSQNSRRVYRGDTVVRISGGSRGGYGNFFALPSNRTRKMGKFYRAMGSDVADHRSLQLSCEGPRARSDRSWEVCALSNFSAVVLSTISG